MPTPEDFDPQAEVALLPTDNSGPSNNATVAKRPLSWVWVLIAVAALVVGWFVLVGGDEQLAPTAEPTPTTGASSEPTPTTEPSSESLEDAANQLDSEVDISPFEDLDFDDSVIVEGPILGTTTGLGLIYPVPNQQPTLLDLDTGQKTKIGAVDSGPIASIGTMVLMGTGSLDRREVQFSLVDLKNPQEAPVAIDSGDSDQLVFVDAVETFRFIDLSVVENLDIGGRALLEISVDGQELSKTPVSFDAQLVGGDWALSDDSGIYRRSTDTRLADTTSTGNYERVFDGQLLAMGSDIALVTLCDNQLSCDTSWFSTESWETLDNPVLIPVDRSSLSGATVLADRWFLASRIVASDFAQDDRIVDVFEIQTGEDVYQFGTRLGGDLVLNPENMVPPVAPGSANSKWLLDTSSLSGAVVVDLETGDRFPVDIPQPGFPVAIFVDLS